MLWAARDRYPWFEMQSIYEFSGEGISKAVADAIAMRTVKSTIIPNQDLLEA
jgi:hypothetical protein